MKKLIGFVLVLCLIGCDNTVTQNGSLDFLQEGIKHCENFGGVEYFEVGKPYGAGWDSTSSNTVVTVRCSASSGRYTYLAFPIKRDQ